MNREQRLAADGYAGIEPITFYKPSESGGCLSNFSLHGVCLFDPFTGDVRMYSSGEHRFQAMKARNWEHHDFIASSGTPGDAKGAGSYSGFQARGEKLREGWGDNYGDLCWYVMTELCLAKAVQNDDVYEFLVSTGDLPIYEDSPVDDIWGWRYREDYSGKNLLGRAWVQTRSTLIG